jgi:hypothetical protein
MSERPLRILVVMLHAGFVRNYDEAYRELIRRGHRLHIVHETDRDKLGENTLLRRLMADEPSVRGGVAPGREKGTLTDVVRALRTYLDYLRYLDPRYARADRLRDRVERLVPPSFRRIAALFGTFGQPGIRLLQRMTIAVERSVPTSTAVRAFITSVEPDILLVTPLVDVGSDQPDYVRAAADLGVPSALCVASWDNLTNKGLMRTIPDRVLLWNEAQRAEAIDLHGVPGGRVRVTGAQLFDQWFGRTPSRSRAEFCRRVGLSDERPFILYLGSSYFIAPTEAEFATRWVAAIRAAADPALAEAHVLIRPHPNNTLQWLKSDVTSDAGVSIWPPYGADPFEPSFKEDFFDSLYHCAAVVGVNTSAQIEAAILEKPVCTVTEPEFAHSQAGTLHFSHLADPDTGVLVIAETMDRHVEHLSEALADPSRMKARSRAFVERFVRPRGLDTPATSHVVAEIEDVRSAMPDPARRTWGQDAVLRWFSDPLAPLIAWCWKKPSSKDLSPGWLIVLRPTFMLGVWLYMLWPRSILSPRGIRWLRKGRKGAVRLRWLLRLRRVRNQSPRWWRRLSRAGVRLGRRVNKQKKAVSDAIILAGKQLRRRFVLADKRLRRRFRKLRRWIGPRAYRSLSRFAKKASRTLRQGGKQLRRRFVLADKQLRRRFRKLRRWIGPRAYRSLSMFAKKASRTLRQGGKQLWRRPMRAARRTSRAIHQKVRALRER